MLSKGLAPLIAVLAALVSVVDISTKALALTLQRHRVRRPSPALALLAAGLSLAGGSANLLDEIKITRVLNAVAAGTTDQNSSEVDMQGWDGVLFVALFGTLTATQVTQIKAQQDTVTGMAGAQDLAGTLVGPLADGDSNKALVLDVYRPQERFVRCVVDRGTANAVIDGVIAIQYKGRLQPTTQAASVAFAEKHASPAEGTA